MGDLTINDGRVCITGVASYSDALTARPEMIEEIKEWLREHRS